MIPPTEREHPHDLILRQLEKGSVHVYLDPRVPGVVVPSAAAAGGRYRLVLQLSLAVPDLMINNHGLSGTLLFQGQDFWCCVPWAAIYVLLDETGMGGFYSQNMPVEEMCNALRAAPAAPAPQPGAKVIDMAAARARLRPNTGGAPRGN